MKKSTKWIIGILVAIIVIAVIGFVAMAWLNFGNGGWEYGMRTGRLWDRNQLLPRGTTPWNMPMHSFRWSGAWSGFFGLFRLFGGLLLCLGLPALFIFGIALLIKSSQRSTQVSPPPTAPSAPQAAPSGKNCPSCGRFVQEDWSHCPYCGKAQDNP